MIHIRQANFQVVLWVTDRSGHEPALEMGFDTREEAEAAFDEQVKSGRYQTAILMEFRKRMGAWNLLKSHPATRSKA
jgi:hypothetical protein